MNNGDIKYLVNDFWDNQIIFQWKYNKKKSKKYMHFVKPKKVEIIQKISTNSEDNSITYELKFIDGSISHYTIYDNNYNSFFDEESEAIQYCKKINNEVLNELKLHWLNNEIYF